MLYQTYFFFNYFIGADSLFNLTALYLSSTAPILFKHKTNSALPQPPVLCADIIYKIRFNALLTYNGLQLCPVVYGMVI